ncbi:MAG: T9SS type A sorting domain-containing protein [Crocinitomicaceae bacterium]
MKAILSFFVMLFLSLMTHAETIIVLNTNNSGTGSLRQAVINSVDGDTIRFDSALIASGSDTILLNSDISFTKGLVFKGLYNSTDTLYVSGQNITEIFVANLSTTSTLTLVLDSMCLVNGYHPVSGGAVDFRGDKLELRNSYFFNNRAISYGGAIQAIAKNVPGFMTVEVDISNTKINHNLVFNAAGGGVNISAQEETIVNISNSEINFNESLTGPGGGIIAFSNTRSTKITILNSEINSNIAGDEGGGLYTRSVSNSAQPNPVDSVQLTIVNSSISYNSAQLEGGGIYTNLISNNDNCSYLVTLKNCKINNNSSLDDGGGIYSRSNNTIFDLESAEIVIEDSELKNNTALNGGGGYLDSDYTVPGGISVKLINSTIDQNSSSYFGGGIYTRGYYAQVEVDKSTFSGNTSGDGGGLYFATRYRLPLFNQALSVVKSTISSNSAMTGGGVFVSFSNPDIESINTQYSTFYNNSAVTGGAIYANSTTSIAPYALKFKSSIIGVNGSNSISATNLQSEGYNIFSDPVVTGSVASDQLGIDSTSLNLTPLQNNGGSTLTHMPNATSLAIDTGDPQEFSASQNWIISGIRESGAAELTSIIYDTLIVAVCDSFIVPSGNQVLFSSGVYSDTLFGSPNDTLFTIDLTNNQSAGFVAPTVCNSSFIAPSGAVFSSSGLYQDTIPNAAGCDSIITIDLTINSNSFSNVNEFACSSYTGPSGQIYTSNGTYTDTIPNAIGCDSIITINLTFQESYSTLVESICTANYTAPSGAIYLSSGVYSDTIVNALGCDSIITVDLTINLPTSSTVVSTECDTYISPAGNVYTTSGVYSDTILNAVGCDSVITLDLTIVQVNTSVVNTNQSLEAVVGATNYQWLDCNNALAPVLGETAATFVATLNGSYAVQIEQNGCVDTSACIAVDYVEVFEMSEMNWAIYPNPTVDKVMINFNEQVEEGRIKVIDPQGKLIQSKMHLNVDAVEFSLGSASGLYFVEISVNERTVRFPVIKL